MPRRKRYYLPDIPQHLIQRGHNRQTVFYSTDDYEFYLDCLRESAGIHGCAVHAYALMPNHIHLLVTPYSSSSLSRMLQSIGRRFVQHINHAQHRSGTLWEGRYRACLVEPNECLLDCLRFIEMNPVRHGLVAAAHEYPWSSCRHHAWGTSSPALTRHPSYLSLGGCDLERQETYRQLLALPMEENVMQEIRESLNNNRAFGSFGFHGYLEKQMDRPIRAGKPGRPRKNAALPDSLSATQSSNP